MIIENMENGTIIDFAHHFPTFPHQKGTDIPCDSAEMRLHWLSRIFGYNTGGSVIKLKSLRYQFKVFMIMCNMKVADIEMMMNRLDISTETLSFLEAEAEASVDFERLQVLHQCCADHVYTNDTIIIQIYQSRFEHGLLLDTPNWQRIKDLWERTEPTQV